MQRIISGGNELLDAKKILKEELALRPASMVGDLGCGGAGYFTLASARIVGDQGQVYAVDILKTVLSSITSKARMQKLYNIKTVWSNLEVFGATEIPSASLDYAYLVNILFQSHKHEEIMREAHRLLKPQGSLMIIDWNKGSMVLGPSEDDKIDIERIRTYARLIGLQEVKTFSAGQYHFGVIFMKV
jgi:ubiquinone/menaquinone biosynthesis C-methylase UbiE